MNVEINDDFEDEQVKATVLLLFATHFPERKHTMIIDEGGVDDDDEGNTQ